MRLPHGALLQRLVGRAKELPSIAAIGAYGSTASESWTEYSDLDLILIVNQSAPVNSIHFFVHGVPVDLNLKQRESWTRGDYGWLPPGEVVSLWDPEGLLRNVQRPSTTSSSDAHQYRYAHRHRLLKLMKWIGHDEDIADLMAAGATHWIAVSWFHARSLRFPGIDQAVIHWRTHQPEMIDLLIGAARDRHDRFERITEASELALAPIGGLWSEGEVHLTGWQGTPSESDAAVAEDFLSLFIAKIEDVA